MASGHVNRVNRPNTWLHRPMLQTFKKVLANSEPSTHGGKADMRRHERHVRFVPPILISLTRASARNVVLYVEIGLVFHKIGCAHADGYAGKKYRIY